jgi:hypothetical protein
MAVFKTLQFLPEIFQTDTNRKFLNATVDQLVSEPNLTKINGYIGRKLAPSYKIKDSYISEPTKSRQDYQLEPTVIIKDPTTGNLTFATTYLDIINKIKFYGGLSDNHSRLFENEFYSFNPQIDLDKFVNFSQYYWLQNGPTTVVVSASSIPLTQTFQVTFDLITNTYRISGFDNKPNPVITLARGGVYTFEINEPGNTFYIQTKPGLLGTDPNAPNLTTRTIYGIDNNGKDVGSFTFTVPTESAQEQWTSMPIAGTVNYATNLSYASLQGSLLSDLDPVLGGLDGLVFSIESATVVFVNNSFIDDVYWNNIARLENNIIYLDNNELIPLANRNNIYEINIYEDDQGRKRIYLSAKQFVNNNQKVRINAGVTNAGKEFYSRLDIYNEVPSVTAPLDLLYYQSSLADSAIGGIQIIDPVGATIDVDLNIIGQSNYTSPNGVAFTNGLKITFDSSVTDPYKNKTYYVEGVGKGIQLVLIDDLVCPELDNDLSEIDYFTINRASIDLNGWSRSNRWFHVEVLEASSRYNDFDLILDQSARAQRPIIEFNTSLQLFNFGRVAKAPVDILDTSVTNAFTQIQGIIVPYVPPTVPTSMNFAITLDSADLVVGRTYTITTVGTTNWESAGAPAGYTVGTEFTAIAQVSGTGTATDTEILTLTDGDRVVFSVDKNLEVRNKIYNFTIELFTEAPDTLEYIAYIIESDDTTVAEGNTIIVNSGENGNKQWYFNGEVWVESQQKTSVNHAPLFDIINQNGVSLSDNSVYPGSTFAGTKLFSYKQGTGANDSILGFPLSYKNLLTQGDIIFENNFDIDTFNYLIGDTGLYDTVPINFGLLQQNLSLDTSIRVDNWTINSYYSKQYQIFNFVYDGTTNLFPIDILPDQSTDISNIKVVVNNSQLKSGRYGLVKAVDKLAVLVDPNSLAVNDVVFAIIYNSSATSNTGFYQVPVNFDINSLNTNIETLTLGQIRNHLTSYKNNSVDFIGDVPGKSNIRDIDFYDRGGAILQHSAPLIYSGLFLNHPKMNFVDAIQLASKEYTQFKIKFLELAANLELDRTNIAACVDTIMGTLNSVKNDSFPWHLSDMIPHGDNERVVLPSYTVIDPEIRSYEITNIFEDTKISNKAVLIYLTRTLDGETTTELLLKGRDYIFSATTPAIIITDTFNLLFNDILTVVEYNDTDGSYVPETPTKLGLYPKFTPEIYIDTTLRTPRKVIQGHDGSLTPAFEDFRDDLLLELERRIFNNCKVEYNINNFNINDYNPGKFRIADYSRQEFNQLLSQSFLRWVGLNRVDFTTNNTFTASDPFTWNYKKFRDVVNGETLPGTWRSIFRYFFDTDRPHTHPWEMLGFSEKPEYWNNRYGPAPYTGGNFVLWNDLEIGYIHDGPRRGIDLRYSRPRVIDEKTGEVIQRGLTDIIPVDENGNLRNPSEFLVTDFDSANANLSYAVGDIGPPELAWRRSSDFAFAMQYALALAKPAKYFSLLADVQKYYRNEVTGQFVDKETNQHLQPTFLRVNGYVGDNGTTERSAGYINWIRDYLKSLGINDASTIIKDNLAVISVQLSYKMAGYTDKKFIELLAEQVSPSSINDSVLIPEENYSIELFKGAPLDKIVYSAVIVEKTANGYTVSGYNTTNPYFEIIPSQPNNNAYTIEVNGERGVIYKDAKNQRFSIPYGFEFNTKQQIVDFLVSYQRHLISKGFVFDDRQSELNEKKDWVLSAKEFLHWSIQGWKSGNILVLSPVSDTLNYFNDIAVVDEISNTVSGSRIIDINYEAIKKNNFTIIRDSNLFKIQSLAQQTIGLIELNVVQYEHLIIFDNTTVFRDIIYVPETGNRQFRLKLVGAKTNFWNGSLELPGYIYSSSIVEEWKPGQDYLKGSIVSHKSRFYTALGNISAEDQFQTSLWQQLGQNELRSGVINNFATNASDSLKYYDINDQPLDEKFRPRDYFTNLGIDVTTQSKFYQGLITQGGTVNAVNALKGAQFNNLNTELVFFENWAFRVGEYGAIDTNNFIEFVLEDSKFDTNPAVFQVTDSTIIPQPDIVNFDEQDVYKINGPFKAEFLRTETLAEPNELKPLPVAGFVNIDDVDDTIFNLQDYKNFGDKIKNIGTGYTLWTARDFNNDWNVFRATDVPGTAFILRYQIDSQAELVLSAEHGLIVGDLIALKNLDTRYDGFYVVNSIVDSTRVLVTVSNNLQDLINEEAVIGTGIVFKFTSSKLASPVEVVNNTPDDGWKFNDKIWVENLDDNSNWGVYTKTDPWKYQARIQLGESQYAGRDHFGQSVALDSTALFLYAGAPDSGSGRVSAYARNVNTNWDPSGFIYGTNPLLSGFGKVLATALVDSASLLAVGAPDSDSKQGVVYIYENQILMQILADDVGSPGDQFGASLAMSDDARYLYIGAPGANKVYCYSLNYTRSQTTQTIIGDGVNNTFSLTSPVTASTDIIVSSPLRSAEYFPGIDYVASATTITFTSIPDNFDRIVIQKRINYYTLLRTLPLGAETTTEGKFGSSVACNEDGSVIAIGAAGTTVSGSNNSGQVFVYHKTVSEFVTNGITNTYVLPNNLGAVYFVYFNDTLILNGTDFFIIGSNIIQLLTLPDAGNKLRVESNQFVLDQIISPEFLGQIGGGFGTSIAMCSTGCNLYVTSPTYVEPNYGFGIVTRYVNVGRVYGEVLGTVENPTVTAGQSIIINNITVTFTGTTLSSVVININNANIPGVTASAVNNKLKITSNVKTVGNKLSIVSGATGVPLQDLGLTYYKYTQVMRHPENQGESFGSAVNVDQGSGTLIIASNGADISSDIIFDIEQSSETLFDSGSTKIVDFIKDSGAVYVYNLMANPYESVDSPALYAFTQKIYGPNLATGFNFGAGVAIKNDYLLVGVSNDYEIVPEGGSVFYFYNQNAKSGWTLTRFKQPRVDIGAITSSFLYNTNSQNVVDFFDYIDPAKGKLLGVVEQELDYKEDFDPANYNKSTRPDTINNTSFYWSNRHLGRTWWDLLVASFIDYEQDILQYRAKNWASLFPGSQVVIYEWVESNFLPSQYSAAVGDGFPKYSDDSAYSSVTLVDPATGIITQKYYFWVFGKTNVDVNVAKRTLSTTALEKYIINPKDQNIPYLATIAPNALAVYNISDKLIGNSLAIHLDFAEQKNSNIIHNEWQLVQQNAGAESIPLRFISKLKDSLSGFDSRGLLIPDPTLNPQDKLGILEMPRQSLFQNRLDALKIYVQTLNRILTDHPILLISTPGKLFSVDPIPITGFDTQTDSVTDLTFLNTEAFANGYKILIPSDSNYQGKWSIYSFDSSDNTFNLFQLQSYKTDLFWEPIDWYSETFQFGKDINYVINIYSETQRLNLGIGDYVKVLDNGQGNWIIYEVKEDLSLELVAAQNGTLQVLDKIYDVTQGSGYDSAVYDSITFDPQAVKELQIIYESVYQEILIGNLSSELNRLFLTLVNYVFSEQKNPDWIFKTSFIDVYHNLRTLEQFPNYVRDNQIFYNDYINEVKPYRTQVREYIPAYYKQEDLVGQWTDFDLPSAYDARYDEFRSPDASLASDAELLKTPLYADWNNNYKLKVTDFIVGNIGMNYILPPNVEITGGGGSGASAITTLFGNGKVQSVIVTNAGFGYTLTPNVFINGDGVGATAYPLMNNEFFTAQANLSYNLIRSVETTIKFDRLSYVSNCIQWQPNKVYANTVVTSGNTLVDSGNIYISSGNIIVYNNEAYLVTNASVTAQSIFDFTRYTKISSSNVLLNALDRVTSYYDPLVGMPGKNLPQLLTGIEYPGTTIIGPDYRANAFSITSNVISFSYEGLTINSGNISLVDFVELGFELDQSIRLEANVPFDFQNNSVFTIVNVERDSMTITGQPVETTYKMFLNKTITVNKGDYITQSNNVANARVLQSVVNSDTLDIIYTTPSFYPVTEGNIYANLFLSLNGSNIAANVTSLTTFGPSTSGGNVDVRITYLDLQNVLDSNIYSVYTDSNLGIRPQDINISGGAYVDLYSSHAPEELIPGRMYDALELRVFTNTIPNTATYGFRTFQPMSGNIVYARISSNATTNLGANLHVNDDEIIVEDISKLPDPSPSLAIPGVIFINGEKITYYQKYDAAKLSTAIPWTANTSVPVNTLITFDSNVYLTKGNTYANASAYINTANVQLIKENSLRQIRRGVDGTGTPYKVLGIDWNDFSYRTNLIPSTANVSLSVAGQDSRMSDLYFREDGLKLYTVGQADDRVSEYTLATAWNILTASNVASFSVAAQEAQPTNLFFDNTGLKMYIVGVNTNNIHEYSLATAWQVNTASFITSFSTAYTGLGISTLDFKSDGTKFYIIGLDDKKIAQYSLATPWQTNTAVYISESNTISTIAGNANALVFDSTGSYLYVTDSSSSVVKEYNISTPWNTSSNITFVANSVSLGSNNLKGLFWKYDGRSLFIINDLSDTVDEYKLVSPFTGNLVSDSSQQQLIPDAQISTAITRSGNVTVTANVTYKIILSSTITANIGDYITQFANTGNARVLQSVTNSSAIAVDFVTGVFQTAANIGTRVNLVSLTSGVSSLTANVVSQNTLGSVFANGNVVLSSTSVLQSNIWEQFGTTLQNSTTTGAQFIKAEPSYTP